MAEMRSLTINGKTFTVADPDAGSANIDDSKLGTDAWSSQKIVDMLAPAFSETGSTVTCSPVEGYPLDVVSKITPVQEGSGNPSPDNVRPITGWTGAKLTHGNENESKEITLDFGQTVYGGSIDWVKGTLTVDTVRFVLDENSQISVNISTNSYAWLVLGLHNCPAPEDRATVKTYSDKFKAIPNMPNNNGEYNYHFSLYETGVLRFQITPYMTLAEVKAWLAENPVTICYTIAQPYTVQLTPNEILALSGVNTLQTDTGDTKVSGRADPTAVIETLTNAITALGGNI